jgi:glycosyltransferase involved in cell wall biosynthesis
MTRKTLYLCYFGLREPLVQTQVLPYLRQIQKDNVAVSLLTFEQDFKQKWTAEQIESERRKLAEENIDWHCLAYHKRPTVPATVYDVLSGAWRTWHLMRREKFDVIHSRVHVPMLMAVLARKLSRQKPKLIFDIRGFFPEEYTDAGRWKENGWLYRAVKRAEKWLLKEADAFVVLTERAQEILFPESRETGFDKFGRPVEVIPCCVNLEKFAAVDESLRENMKRKLNLQGRRVIVYVGSFGGWYLTDEMLDFLTAARAEDKSTFALILTQRETEKIVAKLEARGFSPQDYLVTSVAPAEIPAYLAAADVALSFIKKCYSKQASSPTKIAEYLAGGLPVVSNRGIGDLDKLIEVDKVGALISDFSKESYVKSLREINELRENADLAEICRTSARRRFDHETVGGEKYRSLYRRLFLKK